MKKLFLVLLTLALVGCIKITEEVKKAEVVPAQTFVQQGATTAAEVAPVVETADTAATTVAAAIPAVEPGVFVVYSDKDSLDNHFIPSGWMGDYGDIKFNDAWSENPHSGSSCIKIEYITAASQGARWAGIYWQYPQNNWGNLEQSYNLSGKSKLIFWARGEKGGERIEEFKVGGISGMYPDSDSASIGPVVLTAEWTQYTIDLAGKDLSHIIGGFAWSTNIDVNPNGAVFYLDDIQFE